MTAEASDRTAKKKWENLGGRGGLYSFGEEGQSHGDLPAVGGTLSGGVFGDILGEIVGGAETSF